MTIFNRKESIRQAILDKSIDKNTLFVIIDFHMQRQTLDQQDGWELLELLSPPEQIEEIIEE